MRLSFWEVNAYDAVRLNYFNRVVSVNAERKEENNPYEVFWSDYFVQNIDVNDFRAPDDSIDVEKLRKAENEFYARLLTEKEKFLPFSQYGKKIFGFESMKDADDVLQNRLLCLLQPLGHPFFKEKEMQEIFERSRPFVIGRYGIMAAIQFYKQQIEKKLGSEYDECESYVNKREMDYFTEAESTERLQYLFDLYENHMRIWERNTAECKGIFNLQPECENPDLVSSDRFEYEIINLYNILHYFEWNKNFLVLCVEEG